MTRARLRDLGIAIGHMPTGAYNAITDVAGVWVGHTTLIYDEPRVARTGVTMIVPHGGNVFREKVSAAVHTINGYGKPLGFEQVRELGNIESPIALTNTLNIGLVADALVQYAIAHNPDIGITTSSVNVVVGETNDGYLNDMQGRHVRAEHVFNAIDSASADVIEGAVGAGTGTSCYGWKGGIGTASRVVTPTPALPRDKKRVTGEGVMYTVGALVQSNFGRAQDLMIGGVPVGRLLPSPSGRGVGGEEEPHADKGSVMVVLATDAPCDSQQLHRLCVRAAAGLARTGSIYGHGSGDFVVAFSTARRILHDDRAPVTTQPVVNDEGVMDDLFRAVVESVEEAVINSLCAAETTTGRDGHVRYALPLDDVRVLMSRSDMDVNRT